MVSEHDRARMQRIARDMVDGESNERGTPEQRRALLEYINTDRSRNQLAPLTDLAPEEGFYERARSLGMARIDR